LAYGRFGRIVILKEQQLQPIREITDREITDECLKRGKYWIVQFNHNRKTYTRSSKSTRKRDALELERQMRQQLVDTQVLGHREHILYRSKVSNDEFIPMTSRLRATLLNRRQAVDGEYVFPGRFGRHKTIQNNRALEAAFRRAGVTDVSSHNLRKTFATRLLSRGAAITDVQHLLGHASVKTTEKAYAAFVKNERFKQTIDLLDQPVLPKLKVTR